MNAVKRVFVTFCRKWLLSQMTKAEDVKTKLAVFKSLMEVCIVMKWLSGGEDQNRMDHAQLFFEEREFRRLKLHRVMEHPNLSESDRAVVSNMIEQSKARQNQCLDVMRGIQ
jgi:hypothetical protein